MWKPFLFFLILLSCFPECDLKGGPPFPLMKSFQSEDQMGGKNMNTKWGHILSRFAFEFNCRIGKTHILCGWGGLYIYILYLSLSLSVSLWLSLSLSVSLSLSRLAASWHLVGLCRGATLIISQASATTRFATPSRPRSRRRLPLACFPDQLGKSSKIQHSCNAAVISCPISNVKPINQKLKMTG